MLSALPVIALLATSVKALHVAAPVQSSRLKWSSTIDPFPDEGPYFKFAQLHPNALTSGNQNPAGNDPQNSVMFGEMWNVSATLHWEAGAALSPQGTIEAECKGALYNFPETDPAPWMFQKPRILIKRSKKADPTPPGKGLFRNNNDNDKNIKRNKRDARFKRSSKDRFQGRDPRIFERPQQVQPFKWEMPKQAVHSAPGSVDYLFIPVPSLKDAVLFPSREVYKGKERRWPVKMAKYLDMLNTEGGQTMYPRIGDVGKKLYRLVPNHLWIGASPQTGTDYWQYNVEIMKPASGKTLNESINTYWVDRFDESRGCQSNHDDNSDGSKSNYTNDRFARLCYGPETWLLEYQTPWRKESFPYSAYINCWLEIKDVSKDGSGVPETITFQKFEASLNLM